MQLTPIPLTVQDSSLTRLQSREYGGTILVSLIRKPNEQPAPKQAMKTARTQRENGKSHSKT